MSISDDEGAFARRDTPPHDPDPYGHAALLLIESLIHGLIARGTISPAEAREIIAIATEAKAESAAEYDEVPATRDRSLGLLTSISFSLRADSAER